MSPQEVVAHVPSIHRLSRYAGVRTGVPGRAARVLRVNDLDIGAAKRARRAYSFDDVAIVPSRRTRDPEEVSIAWQIDA